MPARTTLTFALLLAACGGSTTTTDASAAAGTSGGERPRPTGTPIASSATSGTAGEVTPRAMSREEFEAQWATSRATATVAAPLGSGPAPGGGPYAAYGGMGYDTEHPIPACGAADSYQIVASYVCPDGSVPLAGDPSAGAAARLGNVGANSAGHIIDLYSVPCTSGAVQLYVDMYSCGGAMPF